jgi:hypothetical protein
MPASLQNVVASTAAPRLLLEVGQEVRDVCSVKNRSPEAQQAINQVALSL